MEIGLETMNQLITQVASNNHIANQFFKAYFMQILQEIVLALTDSYHKCGFKLQSTILMKLIVCIEQGVVRLYRKLYLGYNSIVK